jgi:hypothetical protein
LPRGQSKEIVTSADQITEEQESYSRKALNLLPLIHLVPQGNHASSNGSPSAYLSQWNHLLVLLTFRIIVQLQELVLKSCFVKKSL